MQRVDVQAPNDRSGFGRDVGTVTTFLLMWEACDMKA
jgi:hypothetical protein